MLFLFGGIRKEVIIQIVNDFVWVIKNENLCKSKSDKKQIIQKSRRARLNRDSRRQDKF